MSERGFGRIYWIVRKLSELGYVGCLGFVGQLESASAGGFCPSPEGEGLG